MSFEDFGQEENCWQDMARPEKMKKLLDEKILSDCKFLVGPEDSTAETIFGHRLMFIIESPVFENMMTGSFTEGKPNEIIRIKDILPQDFRNFLDLMYYNDLSNYSKYNFQEIFEIYRIARKYLVSSITKNCIKFLRATTENPKIRKLIELFEFACEEKELSNFQDEIENVISKEDLCYVLNEDNINELSFDAFYKYMSFVKRRFNKPTDSSTKAHGFGAGRTIKVVREGDASTRSKNSLMFEAIHAYFEYNNLFEFFEKIMKQEGANKKVDRETSQICVFKKLDQNVDCEENKAKIELSTFRRNILKLVEFNEMSAMEFINGPGNSALLDSNSKYRLLAHIFTKNVVNKNQNRIY